MTSVKTRPSMTPHSSGTRRAESVTRSTSGRLKEDRGCHRFFRRRSELSRYLHVLDLDATGNPIEENGYYRVIQAEDNPINYPLFQLGTVPFHGDYLEITPSVRILPPAIAFGFWNLQHQSIRTDQLPRGLDGQPRCQAAEWKHLGRLGQLQRPGFHPGRLAVPSAAGVFGRLQNRDAESERLYGQYQQGLGHGVARKHQAARSAADRRGRQNLRRIRQEHYRIREEPGSSPSLRSAAWTPPSTNSLTTTASKSAFNPIPPCPARSTSTDRREDWLR